jgi:hypothetical protein
VGMWVVISMPGVTGRLGPDLTGMEFKHWPSWVEAKGCVRSIDWVLRWHWWVRLV